MYRFIGFIAAGVIIAAALPAAQQPSAGGPYKVVKSARVGGEGGWDYLYADADGRRLYIARGAVAAQSVPDRVMVYDLDSLAPIGEIAPAGGHGAVIDSKSNHGFVSGKPVTMFDTKTLKVIKTIDVGMAQPDGMTINAASQRVYVFSHPTKDATVIDAKDGTVLGTIDLGGVPEQGVTDGKGLLYVVMQDNDGSVTVVDEKTMKTMAHYPLGAAGGCNGLALDAKNSVLFAACARSGNPLDRTKPMMVVLGAKDGKVLANLPLAGSSDGAAFNPATLEAFSTHGNGTLTIVKETSPTTFEVEQNLDTMNGARVVTFDSKTNRVLTMAQEFGAPAAPAAPPSPAPAGGAAPAAARGGGRGAVVPGSFTILAIGK
jgi:DNA-binding beta-propeller fold protein YncE